MGVVNKWERKSSHQDYPKRFGPRAYLCLAGRAIHSCWLASVAARIMPASEAGTVKSTKTTPRSGQKRKADVDGACGDLLQDIYEESIQEIVSLLRKEPSETLPCLRIVKGDSLLPKVEGENASGEAPFNKSYTKLYRVPKDDARTMMVCLLPEIDDAEDGATRAVFYYIHGVSEGTRWPKPALDRSIFRDMFAEVRLKLGDRIGGLKVYRGAKDQVNIDWNHFGYYRILPEDDGEKT